MDVAEKMYGEIQHSLRRGDDDKDKKAEERQVKAAERTQKANQKKIDSQAKKADNVSSRKDNSASKVDNAAATEKKASEKTAEEGSADKTEVASENNKNLDKNAEQEEKTDDGEDTKRKKDNKDRGVTSLIQIAVNGDGDQEIIDRGLTEMKAKVQNEHDPEFKSDDKAILHTLEHMQAQRDMIKDHVSAERKEVKGYQRIMHKEQQLVDEAKTRQGVSESQIQREHPADLNKDQDYDEADQNEANAEAARDN